MSRKICTCEGCGKIAVSHGLCNTHRQRLRRHGSVDAGRPADWGSRESHPMWHSHQAAKRSGTLCQEWHDDFWAYVKGVGDRQEGKLLKRLDTSKPFGPDNFKWVDKVNDDLWRADNAAYQREHRKNNQDQHKGYELKKRFGINLQQFMEMHDKQDGKCAICGNPETDVVSKTGQVRDLAVDHNHKTGQIRALLCRGCNQGLGNFQEDLSRLEAAVSYLKRFAV